MSLIKYILIIQKLLNILIIYLIYFKACEINPHPNIILTQLLSFKYIIFKKNIVISTNK